jgi:hypothetical protein
MRRASLIRWSLLLPSLVAATFLSIGVFQLIFPFFRNLLGYSQDDLYGMSVMDQEFVFGPYGLGITAFFLVLTAYTVAPRFKAGVAIVALLLLSPFYFGIESFTESMAICGLAGLFFSILVHRGIQRLQQPN